MNEIKGLLLDMDGLLIDSERFAVVAWDMSLREFGYDASPEGFAINFLGRGTETTSAYLREKLGANAPVEEMKIRRHQIGMDLVLSTPLEKLLLPGALRLFDCAEAAGMPICVCTSTERERAEVKLRACGLFGRVAGMVCGDEIPNGKPAPDIFIAGAKLLGVPPNLCAAVEDAPAGLKGALAAGARALAVPDLLPVPCEIEKRVETCCSLFDVASRLFPQPAETVDMRLYEEPFALMESGEKVVEVRLRDEKRRTLCKGDVIRFTGPHGRQIMRRIEGFHPFPTFLQLYKALPTADFGRPNCDAEELARRAVEFYGEERQTRYGALGIRLTQGETR